jgi:hypothetical protein
MAVSDKLQTDLSNKIRTLYINEILMSRLHVLFQVFNPKRKIVKEFKEIFCRRNSLETLEEEREKLSQIDNFVFLGPSIMYVVC